MAGLAQVQAKAQATLDAAQSQFGTQPAPYSQPAQPLQGRAVSAGAPSAYGAYGTSGAGPAYAPPQAETGSLGAPDPTKPLARGDIVTFSITQDREAPQVMRVTDTGELDFSGFPKIGRISVVGRTCAQVAAELKRKLEADYYNAADVSLGINQVNILSSRGRVFITGNVMTPGPQDLPANERTTLSNAIIRAGGFAKFANEHKVKVTRKGGNGKATSYTVDVRSIIVGGHMEKDIELQDGDYINVPQNVINF
jgi:protein involved in polysaccharide export with SLBB domain